jgi:signal transduction protein with GAF and PtsI domain
MVALALPTKDSARLAHRSLRNGRWIARIDGRSSAAKAVRKLERAYRAQVANADDPLVSRRIRELCELEVLLAALRAEGLRGAPDPAGTVPRYANLIARQRAALGLGVEPSDPWGDA